MLSLANIHPGQKVMVFDDCMGIVVGSIMERLGGYIQSITDERDKVSLILDCMDEMKLVQPNSNVTISRKTPAKFLKRACEISRKGWGQPAFYNTEAQIMELVNAGKSLADARRGGSSGCVETGAWGSEAYILTGYMNIPKILLFYMQHQLEAIFLEFQFLQIAYLFSLS